MIIAVAAGKGGTGKTLVATSLAIALAGEYPGRVDLIDCDVEEPNADILLRPVLRRREAVHVPVPQVDEEKCIGCGACARNCQFSAIAVIRKRVFTFPELCSGCGVCAYVCPTGAIEEKSRQVGVVDIGEATVDGGTLRFIQGRMDVGEQRSPPTIKAAKKHIQTDKITVLDAPPGTACPMQETVEEADVCLLVTEPTPFGLHDMAMAVDTCRRLSVPAAVVLNRDGVGDSRPVEEYCRREGLDIVLRIPHDRRIAEAYSRGQTLVAVEPGYAEKLVEVYERLAELVGAQ